MIFPFVKITLLLVAIFGWISPVFANQWVSGRVKYVWDYGGYNPSFMNILVTIENQSWLTQSGDTTNGPTNCTERFRLLIGTQGVDASTLSRFEAILLTAQSLAQPVSMYVETTSTAPYCAIQIIASGKIF